ncbi:MAG: extracellular solute-binding protein [Candidatus Tectomicrobia bacterium]|nr:extracellular solute-binding protein [Candidatus Tectomicrobia bacterium]
MIEIEYWQYSFIPKKNTIDELINMFESANRGIKVKHHTPSHVAFTKEVKAALSEGKGPDIVNLYDGWFSEYVKMGYLIPLPREEFPHQALEEEFFPFIGSAKFHGEYYGLPTAVRTLALFWNREIFQKSELDPEVPPKTWDEFVSAAVATASRDESGNLITAGYGFSTGGQDHHWFRECLLRQNNAPTMSEDRRRVLWNTMPEGYETWEWYLDLIRKHRVSQLDFPPGRHAFESGKAAMVVDGSYEVGNLKRRPVIQALAIAPLPMKKSRATFASYWAHGLTPQAEGERKEAAMQFLKFLTSPEVMKIWADKVGELPARRNVAELQEFARDPLLGPFIEQLPYAFTTFFVDEGATRQAIVDAANAVLKEGREAKAALDEAVSKVNDLLDHYWAI